MRICDVLRAWVTRRSDALLRRVEAVEPGTLAISSIVAHELSFGAHRSQKIEFNLETLRLLAAIDAWPKVEHLALTVARSASSAGKNH